MTAAASTASPRAFVVWFHELERWDPASFHRIHWSWPTDVMQPIGRVLRPRKAKIDRSRVNFSDLQPITIHFDGSIDRRNVDAKREYTMDLFAADVGDIVVAKIDLKNGAAGIVPEGWTNVAVTGHFAVYEPDRSRLVPQYLHLLIQAEFFKKHLWHNKVGAEGRKEVKLDFLESQLIPLPPLRVQRKIVAAWEAVRKYAATTAAKIEQLERNIETRFLADLGLKAPAQATLPKCFAVWWTDIERWGVAANQLAATGVDISQAKYPIAEGRDCLAEVKHGCSASPSPTPTALQILKISAVTRGQFNPNERKHAFDVARYRKEFDLRAGDVLMCRTNGTLSLVGMSALVEADMPDLIYPDKLIRVRCKPNILPAYFWKLVHMAFARSQIEAAARTAVGNYAIGSGDIWALRLPLPPLPIQRQIVERVAKGRAEIARLRADAQACADATRVDLEAMILGAKPVE
jgi:type I restriction enzyme, S subunit